jgi:uncharacterized protein (TIGR03437 family)
MVRPGDAIVALVTGAGRSSPDVSSGVPAPDSPALPIREKVQAFIAQGNDGSECVVQTFTQAPGMIGVAQLKCQINPEAGKPSPEWDFFVTVPGYGSNRVRFCMRPPT